MRKTEARDDAEARRQPALTDSAAQVLAAVEAGARRQVQIPEVRSGDQDWVAEGLRLPWCVCAWCPSMQLAVEPPGAWTPWRHPCVVALQLPAAARAQEACRDQNQGVESLRLPWCAVPPVHLACVSRTCKLQRGLLGALPTSELRSLAKVCGACRALRHLCWACVADHDLCPSGVWEVAASGEAPKLLGLVTGRARAAVSPYPSYMLCVRAGGLWSRPGCPGRIS